MMQTNMLTAQIPHYRARYYDPTVGRFISEDPIGFKGSGTNFYAYVRNSPINLTDPLGLCPNRTQCISNAVDNHALGLFGDALGFIPGESVAKVTLDVFTGTMTTLVSAMQQDTTASFVSIAGTLWSATKPVLKDLAAESSKLVPGLNGVVATAAVISDFYGIYKDYKSCMAGSQ